MASFMSLPTELRQEILCFAVPLPILRCLPSRILSKYPRGSRERRSLSPRLRAITSPAERKAYTQLLDLALINRTTYAETARIESAWIQTSALDMEAFEAFIADPDPRIDEIALELFPEDAFQNPPLHLFESQRNQFSILRLVLFEEGGHFEASSRFYLELRHALITEALARWWEGALVQLPLYTRRVALIAPERRHWLGGLRTQPLEKYRDVLEERIMTATGGKATVEVVV